MAQNALGGAGDPKGPSGGRPALASGTPSSGVSVLGLHLPPDAAHGALLATLALLVGMLLIALAIADDAGIGPRHPEWRARFVYRLTRR